MEGLECEQFTSTLTKLMAKTTRDLYSVNIWNKIYSDFGIRMTLDEMCTLNHFETRKSKTFPDEMSWTASNLYVCFECVQ